MSESNVEWLESCESNDSLCTICRNRLNKNGFLCDTVGEPTEYCDYERDKNDE
jgi:hypothetical protein